MSDFVTEAFTLLAVAIVIIGLRTTARWFMVGPRNFQPDDYLMLLACVSRPTRSPRDDCSDISGGVWTRNGRCVHGGFVVQGPCEQCDDRRAAEDVACRLGGISPAGWRLQGSGCRLVFVHPVAVAAEDVHGRFLFSIDVSTVNAVRVLYDTDPVKQSWFDQHASSYPSRLRFDRRDLYRHSFFHPLRLSSNAQKLADLSESWEYVTDCVCRGPSGSD